MAPLQSIVHEPQICSVCQQPLRLLKHRVAHPGQVTCDAHIRTCPHNLSPRRYDGPRHDEWHECDKVWVKRDG